MLFACGFTLFISYAAYAASIFSEDDDFGRLVFLPPIALKNSCSSSKPYSDACAGKWWNEDVKVGKGDAHSMFWTFGGTAAAPSLSFQFSGSNVTIRGLRHAAGAKAIVVVDGVSHPINTMSVDGNRHPQRVLYSQTLLDPRVNHTLELHFSPATYNGTTPSTKSSLRFLVIDSFRVDSPDADADTDDDVSSDTHRTVVLVIAALGAVVGAVLALALAFAWHRRRRASQRSKGDAYANIDDSPPNVVVPFILPTKPEPSAQHAERARASIVSAPPPYSGIPRGATHAAMLPLPRGSSMSTVTTSRASVIDSKGS